MRNLFTVLLLSFCAGSCLAQAGEQLFVLPPAGWQQGFHDHKASVDITSLLPAGQTMRDWTEMLTVEMIEGKPTMDVQNVLSSRVEAIAKDCEDVGAGLPQLAVENGYESGLRAVACPKSKQWGKGEISLYKVILGRERSYVISRSISTEAFAKEKPPLTAGKQEEWLAFMGKVVLCDPRERNHPCPTGK